MTYQEAKDKYDYAKDEYARAVENLQKVQRLSIHTGKTGELARLQGMVADLLKKATAARRQMDDLRMTENL